MVVLNQEGRLKGQTELHNHGFAKKLKSKNCCLYSNIPNSLAHSTNVQNFHILKKAG